MNDSADTAELLALGQACLDHLAEDVEELQRFMTLTGYDPASLRSSLGTEGLAAGLVDYFGRNEPLLLALCANGGLDIARVMRVWHRINAEA